jgi:hypothetical protein
MLRYEGVAGVDGRAGANLFSRTASGSAVEIDVAAAGADGDTGWLRNGLDDLKPGTTLLSCGDGFWPGVKMGFA